MKRIISILPIIAVFYLNSGFTTISEWDTKSQTEKIKLQYRWVKTSDNREMREFRAVLKVTSDVSSIIRNINEEDRLLQWTAKSKQCKIYGKTEKKWITYTLFDIPKPFSQRDLVLKHTLSNENGKLIIKLEPLPDYLPKQDNVTRMDEYLGYWIITPESDHAFRVEFYYTSTKKPIIPRFIMDPILQKMLMESFSKLIKLSET